MLGFLKNRTLFPAHGPSQSKHLKNTQQMEATHRNSQQS